MTNNEKMEVLVAFLSGNNIEHWENVKVDGLDIVIPLYVPYFNISVFTGSDENLYMTVRRYTRPIFIRDNDPADFIIEKMKNTMRRPKGFIAVNKRKRFKKNLLPEKKFCRPRNIKRKKG